MQPEFTIIDKEGISYPVYVIEDSEHYFEVHIANQGQRVGYVKCLLRQNGNEMCLADIYVEDRVVPSQKGFYRLVPYGVWSKHTARSYRERGLGTELLKIVVEKARKERAVCIWGYVTNQGVGDNPNLLNWYQKHGFQVTPVPSPGAGNTDKVAWIRMDLCEPACHQA